jgi:ribonuclease D
LLGVDTETSGLRFYADQLCLVQVSDEAGDNVAVIHKPSHQSHHLKAVLSRDAPVLFHNARFDLNFLRHHTGAHVPKPRCTMALARSVREPNARLQSLVERHLNQELPKGREQLWFVGRPDAPLTDEVVRYAARDAAVLGPLYQRLLALAGPDQMASAEKKWAKLSVPSLARFNLV